MLTVAFIKGQVRPVFERYAAKEAILFSSYANGCTTEQSDVDMLVDSNLHGFAFMKLYCDVQDALGDIALDLSDRYELIPGGADYEIRRWGIKIYGS